MSSCDDDGKVRTYCVYEAPSEAVVRDHSSRLGQHRIDSIDEIVGDVTPADFPRRLTSSRWKDAVLASASRRRSALRCSASSSGTSSSASR